MFVYTTAPKVSARVFSLLDVIPFRLGLSGGSFGMTFAFRLKFQIRWLTESGALIVLGRSEVEVI